MFVTLSGLSHNSPIMNELTDIALVAASYLIGSLSAAILICRLLGLPDPRSEGSKNPGATNVLRLGGKKAAILTLFGDMLKGLIPVAVAVQLGVNEVTLSLTLLAVFLGHLYPIFFGFKGGKGVATALGALIGLHWSIGLATITTWMLMAAIFRYSSLSALTAILLAPAYVWYLFPEPNSATLTATMAAVTALLYWRHRSNIQNLISGKEDKIGSKKSN